MILLNNRIWLSYWDPDLRFLFMHEDMFVKARAGADSLLELDTSDYLVYGPYAAVAPGTLEVSLWATPQAGRRFLFDCVGTTADGAYASLLSHEFDGETRETFAVTLDQPLERLETRLFSCEAGANTICLNGLRIEHRA